VCVCVCVCESFNRRVKCSCRVGSEEGGSEELGRRSKEGEQRSEEEASEELGRRTGVSMEALMS